MDERIVSQLRKPTKEEEEILNGKTIQKGLYTSQADFTIDSRKMLERGKLIDIRPHTRFAEFPRHKHNYIEILYMVSGKTVHIIDDRVKIVLEAGDLLFLNQYTYHKVLPAGKGDIGINFIILPEFFDVAFSMVEEENELKNFLVDTLRKDNSRGNYLHFHVSGILPIQNLIENMTWSILNHETNRHKINQTTMGLLFLQLMNYTDTLEDHDKEQFGNRLTMNALRYIEENYRDATLEELAKMEEKSIYQVSRLIRTHTGYTFKELLQIKRMNKAVELLTQTTLSIADIIAAVGYDNTSYFFRIFREKFKMSPRKYREKFKKIGEDSLSMGGGMNREK